MYTHRHIATVANKYFFITRNVAHQAAYIGMHMFMYMHVCIYTDIWVHICNYACMHACMCIDIRTRYVVYLARSLLVE